MHPAAESRAPRLNGPKRGPGSHPALCSGLGKGASSSPARGWVPPGLRCGALFQTRPAPPSCPPALPPRALRAGEPRAPLPLEVVPGPWTRTSPTHRGHAALAARGEASSSSSGTAALAGSPTRLRDLSRHLRETTPEGGSAAPPQGVGRAWAPLLSFLPRRPGEKLEIRWRRPGARAGRQDFQHKTRPRMCKIPRARLPPGSLNLNFCVGRAPSVSKHSPEAGNLELENKEEAVREAVRGRRGS